LKAVVAKMPHRTIPVKPADAVDSPDVERVVRRAVFRATA